MRNRGDQRVINKSEHGSKSLKLLCSIPMLSFRNMDRGFVLIKAYAKDHGTYTNGKLIQLLQEVIFKLNYC